MASQEASKTKTVNAGFSWSDDDLELLLESALHYKSVCEYEGTSWQGTRAKYDKIKDIILERYPDDNQESRSKREAINRDRIAAKLKKIRKDYKKAVDAGRRSGGGRVVMTFYNLCESLWGGSPAVTSVPNGLDSSTDVVTVDNEKEGTVDTSTDMDNSSFSHGEEDDDAGSSSVTDESEANDHGKHHRREKIAGFLKNRKDKKINHKLSTESQLLNCTKQEVKLKRKMIERMDKFDSEFHESIAKVSKTMEVIGESFKQTMGLLANALQPAAVAEIPFAPSTPVAPTVSRAGGLGFPQAYAANPGQYVMNSYMSQMQHDLPSQTYQE